VNSDHQIPFEFSISDSECFQFVETPQLYINHNNNCQIKLKRLKESHAFLIIKAPFKRYYTYNVILCQKIKLKYRNKQQNTTRFRKQIFFK
jgi:hypothetical protein